MDKKVRKKGLILILMLILLQQASCSRTVVKKSYSRKFDEGLTQLQLLSHRTNLNFTDTIKKRILIFTVSSAKIRIDAEVTFTFYVDFVRDGYQSNFEHNGTVLNFVAPPIRIETPEFHGMRITQVEKGALINEAEEIEKIKNKLSDRFEQEGAKLIKQRALVDKCEEALSSFLAELLLQQDYGDVQEINVTFYEN